VVTLNDSEVLALNAILDEAIVQSKDDDGDPVYHDVNCESVNPFGDKQTQSDVYDILAKNGFIECSGMEDKEGNKLAEFVCITPQGIEALKAATGVH
jgi:hypothetical protein